MQPLRILSMGWGVQSTTLALMSAVGALPKLDAIIHADTSWESELTHAYIEKHLPIIKGAGINYVALSSLSARDPLTHPENVFVPALHSKGTKYGKIGRLNRQCTSRWKLQPVRHAIWQELELSGREKTRDAVEMWLGISWDEATRAKNSDVGYITHRYPLLEKATRMTRSQCEQWLVNNGFDVPSKSSCTHCTYHDIKTWEAMKRRGGADWQQAVDFDRTIRNKRGDGSELFIHRHAIPLELIRIPEDEGYMPQSALFEGEEIACEVTANCWS